MKCPACHSALVVVEREEIEVDWCPDCHGLWFDEGELELLGRKAGRSLETGDLGTRPGDSVARGRRRCPRCPRRMERVTLGVGKSHEIEIDRCREHGFWLDPGELGSLMNRMDLQPGTDESLVLDFLGETFTAGASAAAEGSTA